MSGLSCLLVALHSLPDHYAPHFDDRLLLSLLLSISNPSPSHLVIRIGTEGDDLDSFEREELTERVEAELRWILQVVFHLVPHIVNCSSKTSSARFIRELLLPTSEPVERRPPLAPQPRRTASHRSEYSLRPSTIKPRPRSNTLTQLVQEAAAEGGMVPRSPTLSHSSLGFRIPPSPSYQASLLATDTLVEDPSPYSGQSPNADESSAGEDLYPAPHRMPPPAKAPESVTRRRGMSASTATSVLNPSAVTPRKYGSLGSRRGSELSLHVPTGTSEMIRRPTSPTPGTSSRNTPRISSSQRSPSASVLSYFGHAGSSKLGERRPSIASVTSQYEMAPSSPLLTPTTAPTRTFRSRSNSPGANKALSPATFGPGSPLSQASPTMARRPSSTLTAPTIGSPGTARPRSAERRGSHRGWEAEEDLGARQVPQVVILSRLERARKSAQQALLDTLREGRVAVGEKRRSSLTLSASASVDGPLAEEASLRGEEDEVKVLPSNFLLIALVCEKKARDLGEDGGWGGVSRHLLDRFSYSHTVSLAQLDLNPDSLQAPDAPPPPGEERDAPPPAAPLAYESLDKSALERVWIAPALVEYTSDLLSALRSHPQLEGRMLSSRTERDLDALLRTWVTLNSVPGTDKEALELRGGEGERIVLPQDALSVLLGVVGHRVAMRDVKEEKSLFWGAEVRELEGRRRGRGGVEGVVRELVGVV